ncbi:MAG: sulfatase-like hydrolase/transferase [Flavonifractor plautii]
MDAMPFLRSLTENTIKGHAYSSVFGGTTANSEYEFLTGNTTAFLPAGTVPYQMYVSDGDPTLVGQMAALGYRTVAAHPYRSSGWSRAAVYRDLGFDRWHTCGATLPGPGVPAGTKTGYVTDRCDYENLIRLVRGEGGEGEPLFLFNVTTCRTTAATRWRAWTDAAPGGVAHRGAWRAGLTRWTSTCAWCTRAIRAFRVPSSSTSPSVEEPTLILPYGDHSAPRWPPTSIPGSCWGRPRIPHLGSRKDRLVPFRPVGQLRHTGGPGGWEPSLNHLIPPCWDGDGATCP